MFSDVYFCMFFCMFCFFCVYSSYIASVTSSDLLQELCVGCWYVPRSDDFASLKALHRSVQFVHRRPQRRGSASACLGQIRNLPLALLALPDMPALYAHFAKKSKKSRSGMSGWLLYTLACDVSGWLWMRLQTVVYLLGALNSGRSFSLHLRVCRESSELMEVPNSADLRRQGHDDESIIMSSWWH